jgi:hypothetical protein
MNYVCAGGSPVEDNDAPYIATMHPGVGLALADWLQYQAFWHESRDAYGYADTPDSATARGIADLILGGKP